MAAPSFDHLLTSRRRREVAGDVLPGNDLFPSPSTWLNPFRTAHCNAELALAARDACISNIPPIIFEPELLFDFKCLFSFGFLDFHVNIETPNSRGGLGAIPRANPETLRPIFERFASKTDKDGKKYMTSEDFIRK
ncbi:hypothetical protein ANCCAN_24713 [Ancylostoma caninum]|uniref:Uncharacterized protein n=1 Tax=Ancylostoma caninum TaxID=29170 RepID=A0A368FH74_ANCCA|nr:hypothetical protein ANCCAN_24713 [Ancylostoma caninum]